MPAARTASTRGVDLEACGEEVAVEGEGLMGPGLFHVLRLAKRREL
jgi:hypothetical protein